MRTLGTTLVRPHVHDYKDHGDGDGVRERLHHRLRHDAAAGFNTDYAPVADVWTNPENTVIGDRAYCDDFDQAAELVPGGRGGLRRRGR